MPPVEGQSVTQLLDLPMDLLLRIQSHCDIEQLLTLRKCCKHLESISRERIVWIHALRGLCYELQLYTPSFPFDDMPTNQLEACATAHLRVQKGITIKSGEGALPRFCSTLGGPLRAQSYTYNGICMAPGGRYLATLSLLTLELWDLHVPFSDDVTLPPAVLLAEVDYPPHTPTTGQMDWWIEVELCPTNPQLLLVRIQGYYSGDKGTWCTVFAIDPLADTPRFEKLGHLDTLAFKPQANYFDPLCMVIVFSVLDGAEIWVWYVSSGAVLCWSEPVEFEEPSKNVFICDHKILSLRLDANMGRVYELPPAPSLRSGSEFVRIEAPLLDTLQWAKEIPDNLLEHSWSFWGSTWNRYQPLHHSFRFDILIRNPRSSSLSIVHMEFSSNSDSETTDRRNTSSSSSFTVTRLHIAHSHSTRHHRKGDDSSIVFPNGNRMIFCVLNWNRTYGPELRFHLSSLGTTEPSGSAPPQSEEIIQPSYAYRSIDGTFPLDPDWPNFEFDPIVGRLCVGGGNEVKILTW